MLFLMGGNHGGGRRVIAKTRGMVNREVMVKWDSNSKIGEQW